MHARQKREQRALPWSIPLPPKNFFFFFLDSGFLGEAQSRFFSPFVQLPPLSPTLKNLCERSEGKFLNSSLASLSPEIELKNFQTTRSFLSAFTTNNPKTVPKLQRQPTRKGCLSVYQFFNQRRHYYYRYSTYNTRSQYRVLARRRASRQIKSKSARARTGLELGLNPISPSLQRAL